MEEPGRLQSMGLLRVRHDRMNSLSLFTLMHWRRKWQPTAVFLPGESQGRGRLVGCRLWGCTESDMTEVTYQQQVMAGLTAYLFQIRKLRSGKIKWFPEPTWQINSRVNVHPRSFGFR